MDLASNTASHLLAEIEQQRHYVDVESWLVFGGSWGNTLALACAEAYPERVTEMILFGVTTGRHQEFGWIFRGGVAILFREQWDHLHAALPVAEQSGAPASFGFPASRIGKTGEPAVSSVV